MRRVLVLLLAVAIIALFVPFTVGSEATHQSNSEENDVNIDQTIAEATTSTVATSTEATSTPPVTLHPALKPVCACESSFEGNKYGTPRHYEKDGITVRTGRVNPQDRGMCQLNAYYWRDKALSLGFDIETREGNIKMANWIHSQHGLQPWKWSRHCWQ